MRRHTMSMAGVTYRITVSRLPVTPRRYIAESGGCSGEGSSPRIAIRRLLADILHDRQLAREEVRSAQP